MLDKAATSVWIGCAGGRAVRPRQLLLLLYPCYQSAIRSLFVVRVGHRQSIMSDAETLQSLQLLQIAALMSRHPKLGSSIVGV